MSQDDNVQMNEPHAQGVPQPQAPQFLQLTAE